MGKLKTKRSAAKRFKLTGSGKVSRNRNYKSHILTKKSRKRKRNLAKKVLVSKADLKNVKDMLLAWDFKRRLVRCQELKEEIKN